MCRIQIQQHECVSERLRSMLTACTLGLRGSQGRRSLSWNLKLPRRQTSEFVWDTPHSQRSFKSFALNPLTKYFEIILSVDALRVGFSKGLRRLRDQEVGENEKVKIVTTARPKTPTVIPYLTARWCLRRFKSAMFYWSIHFMYSLYSRFTWYTWHILSDEIWSGNLMRKVEEISSY